MQSTHPPVLEVLGLSIRFADQSRSTGQVELPVIRDLTLNVHAGEVVAAVGASGSGKSLLAHSILGILPPNAHMEGELRYQGQPLTEQRKRSLRGKEIVLVPQNVSYLDPLMRVGDQVRNGHPGAAARGQSRRVLARYGLNAQTERLYPFELSGGMARRVLIATAAMQTPHLVIADEPTPGLHTEATQRVLAHFREMADARAGVLLITHDLRLALGVADRVIVLYAGTALEEARASDFDHEETLRHPYTRALWRAMPEHGFHAIGGTQPYVANLPAGCLFAPRCAYAAAPCAGEIPYRKASGGYVRCALLPQGGGGHGA